MKIEKLYPTIKSYIWGGEKLAEFYGKKSDNPVISETWELSWLPDGESRLSDGKKLSDVASERDLGSNCASFPFFPVLIKFIDAKLNLSVQVHPTDEYALSHENSYGKTEMWYVTDCDDGAGIYLGFKRDVTPQEYAESINNGTIEQLLNFYRVKKGDHYFIPSGTVHAIGKGCTVCEIQQNSSLTYRVYDYNRVGADGKPRELHVEKAKLVTNLNKFTAEHFAYKEKDKTRIGISKYFTVFLSDVDGEKTFAAGGNSFACISVADGCGKIGGISAAKGDSFFVPASFGNYTIAGKMQILETKVLKYARNGDYIEDDEGVKIFDPERRVCF